MQKYLKVSIGRKKINDSIPNAKLQVLQKHPKLLITNRYHKWKTLHHDILFHAQNYLNIV
jgi:hypothetical protein